MISKITFVKNRLNEKNNRVNTRDVLFPRMKKAAHEAAALKDVFIHLFDGCFFKS